MKIDIHISPLSSNATHHNTLILVQNIGKDCLGKILRCIDILYALQCYMLQCYMYNVICTTLYVTMLYVTMLQL